VAQLGQDALQAFCLAFSFERSKSNLQIAGDLADISCQQLFSMKESSAIRDSAGFVRKASATWRVMYSQSA